MARRCHTETEKGKLFLKISAIINGQCIIVPTEAVMKNLPEANGTKLKVLLCVLASPEFDADALCEQLDITKKTLMSAIDYWVGCGVLKTEGTDPSDVKAPRKPAEKSTSAPKTTVVAENVTVKRPAVMRASVLPDYTAEEISRFLEENSDAQQIINGCQQILGKMFRSRTEIETIVGLMDYLKLGEDYIFLLCSYCAKIGKTSLRYVEKTAVELFDRGITEYKELDSYLLARENANKLEGKLRKLFGTGARSFTKKEKDIIETWAKRGLSYELVERAYEVTVENTGSASMPYCGAVLDNWYTSGIRTADEAEAAIASYKHDKENAKDKKGSFETDDFFEAALRRSYSDEK